MSDVTNRARFGARFGARFLSVSVACKTEIKRAAFATSDISLRLTYRGDLIIVLYII